MFRFPHLLTAVILAASPPVMARCGIGPFIFCEDFDQYCANAPAYPTRCDMNAPPDNTPFYANWTYNGCGEPMRLQNDKKTDGTSLYADTPPYTARYYGSEQDMKWYDPSRFTHDLTPDISAIDPAMTAANGTDAEPLTLSFKYHFHNTGMQYYQNCYLELSLNDERAPTDYALSENCSQTPGCGSSFGFPIICQQDNALAALAGCPPKSTTPRASLAVGVLAYLDVNPCHCDEPVAHAGQNWHLVFFDGLQWWTLKSNRPTTGGGDVVPLNGGPMPPPQGIKVPGDFGLVNKVNAVRMTVKSTTVRVELEAVQFATVGSTEYKYNVSHWQEIPRQYLGPFNRLSLGTGKGCELDPVTGQCKATSQPGCLWANVQGGNHDMDSILLTGQNLTRIEGACCVPDAGCANLSESECVAGGGTYLGDGTVCATAGGACCPVPFADRDRDGDVDANDFGAFQRCYTGPHGGVPDDCLCYNRNADDGIDGDDFAKFANCATGADVPFDPQNPPPGCLD